MTGFHQGRGGFGNSVKSERRPSGNASDLVTPTIKTANYSTGRGGSGNIAKNDSPEEARKAQDVDGKPLTESVKPKPGGRGGAGNQARRSASIEPEKK